MLSDQPVLSNVWWEVKTDDVKYDKALVVYLNSSVGILASLASRNTTEGPWVATKKADLEQLPVLDVRAITPSQLQRLSQLFDDMQEDEFESLPSMAYCPARRRLDDGISEILDLPDLAGLRRLLATEPVVSNQPL